MRRVLTALLVLASLAACAPKDTAGDGQLQIVAALYPLAEIAHQIGGSRIVVSNLTPAGVEPHDIELTTDDVDAIEDADLVLYVGNGLQPGIAKAAAKRDRGALDVGRGITSGGDPHFWLDPSLMVRATEAVLGALEEVDPQHADEYRANAEQYGRDLTGLDERFAAATKNCARRELVTAHAAFGYLAKRYGLTQYSISGVTPDAEPGPAHLTRLEALVREKGVTTIFYEELVPRAFADTLAKETGVKTAVLNPLEGLTKTEAKRGDDYLSVMGRNRLALVDGLGCS